MFLLLFLSFLLCFKKQQKHSCVDAVCLTGGMTPHGGRKFWPQPPIWDCDRHARPCSVDERFQKRKFSHRDLSQGLTKGPQPLFLQTGRPQPVTILGGHEWHRPILRGLGCFGKGLRIFELWAYVWNSLAMKTESMPHFCPKGKKSKDGFLCSLPVFRFPSQPSQKFIHG